MTLEEAIEAFEKDFTVSSEVGWPNDDNVLGRLDMSRAPTGEPYVCVVSGGIKEQGKSFPAHYTSEALAAEAWLTSAWEYAERRGGKTLYWRDRPRWIEGEFVALDQASAMNDPDAAAPPVLKIGHVYSRMLVSKVEEKKGAPVPDTKGKKK